MANIQMKKLCKNFGNVKAVIDLDLDIQDKEMVCLLGPSGCGKTTSLRMLAGLERPSSGTILIGERDVTDLSPRDRDIAMVFENYALYPQMTVFENIAFPLRVKKLPKDEIKKKVEEAAEILEIENLLDRGITQLSGGQKQRVAMGRAIVRNPSAFLMDEPISHLDAKLRAHMRGEIKRLQKDLGTTTVYVTHDQLEAMSMADRVAVMNDGVLQQLGTPGEIFNDPVNEFVAGFIGDPPINFIDGQLVSEGGKMYIRNDEFSFEIPQQRVSVLTETPSVVFVRLGIRPTHFSIHNKQADQMGIPAEVYISEPLGEVQIIDLSFRDKIIKVVTSPDIKTEIGEKVWLSFDFDKANIFNKETGMKIG
ncbi:MAG: sugar ABC transporter ATP-binding protein [Deltaproteobacteria bacterium RBG_13_49_15]|nr:MAG: sugar ABC transporter ATP-binding protein [Deltaproteobacteria bacterium RBG_13_49_15]